MKSRGTIVIAAGGTGGHFFPAEALAEELAARGWTLALMTDQRAGQRSSGIFSHGQQFVLPGAGVAGRGPVRALRGGLALSSGAWQALRLIRHIRPVAVAGFGGYPSVAPVLGAAFTGKNRPSVILHEGNAVPGKANGFLARYADGIATSFADVKGLPSKARIRITGMPVRPAIAQLTGKPYIPPTDTIRLLVWGGSLGARVFSNVVPAAVTALPETLRARLEITQQVRAEDLDRVRSAWAGAGITARVETFFSDVAEQLSRAHLVIGRAGGSSVAEICVAGRPSVLVPLPSAANDEQTANAQALVREGAALMVPQKDFTAASLTSTLSALLTDTDGLTTAASAAAALGLPHAASALADLVEECLPSWYSAAYSGFSFSEPPEGSPRIKQPEQHP
ncbi:undecaprenyldiphospho-muramoylpentapeptide beta-N-acetylglucosaminyltransferase [Acetobacter sp. AN02]|uniref:undecaprenyldiphospho-muramoylpentapeptide beta-N-acetylglucosaminyltransferase n=1 Tax=Acetobacter sp. AN02 TaxID=2894186 RepID=UPI0024346069|nr:undecaprenyldiphospho-muramoylpentapeptide beta-N-acetylglucosaminyltransferase [Acetobacter sp. AN02]MDG6094215.1 undecaprenyldiphospho-muramoylpentapeptide beta-N-acetylglucosaminyltransferase [Acetobacter sp. AN02]